MPWYDYMTLLDEDPDTAKYLAGEWIKEEKEKKAAALKVEEEDKKAEEEKTAAALQAAALTQSDTQHKHLQPCYQHRICPRMFLQDQTSRVFAAQSQVYTLVDLGWLHPRNELHRLHIFPPLQISRMKPERTLRI